MLSHPGSGKSQRTAGKWTGRWQYRFTVTGINVMSRNDLDTENADSADGMEIRALPSQR
jgi:hypothetical protein